MITKSNNHLKSNRISKCKSFFLFYTKSLLFLFYIFNLQKHSHQIIYNIQSFIKIILFHIFYYYFPYSYTAPPPYHTPLLWTLSLFVFLLLLFTFFFLLLLLSSSAIFLLQHLLSFFFFFFISKKKNYFSFSPSRSLSNWCSLQIWRKISLPSFLGSIHSHTLSHGGSKLGFWVDLYFDKWVFYCVLFWVDFVLS